MTVSTAAENTQNATVVHVDTAGVEIDPEKVAVDAMSYADE